jgi:hypothetical protein
MGRDVSPEPRKEGGNGIPILEKVGSEPKGQLFLLPA